MEGVDKAIRAILSSLSTILRYFSSGFAAVLVVIWLFPGARDLLAGDWRVPLALAMLLGPAVYGVHTAIAVRPFWFLIVWRHLRNERRDTCRQASFWRRLPEGHLDACKGTGWSAVTREISLLDRERWLRRAANDRVVRAIQREMDKWGAMHNYLYCLSYVLLATSLVRWLFGKPSSVQAIPSEHSQLVLAAGLLCLVGACWSDYRATRREMELVYDYPQSAAARTQANRAGKEKARSKAMV